MDRTGSSTPRWPLAIALGIVLVPPSTATLEGGSEWDSAPLDAFPFLIAAGRARTLGPDDALALADAVLAWRLDALASQDSLQGLDGLETQRANVALARVLIHITEEGDVGRVERALRAGEALLDVGQARLAEIGDVSATPWAETQRDALAWTRRLVAVLEEEPPGLAVAVPWAKLATQWQAQRYRPLPLDDQLVDPPGISPSQAVHALLATYGASAPAHQAQAVADLDALPAPVRDALARLLQSFATFAHAAREAYADYEVPPEARGFASGDRFQLLAGLDGPATMPLAAVEAPDLSQVLAARLQLLRATHDFYAAAQAAGVEGGSRPPVDLPPYASIRFDASDDEYTQDYALLLDVGGNDTYRNNAGGASGYNLWVGCGPSGPNLTRVAAALVDLRGNDAYVSGRSCGINGGGNIGAGFLFDALGNDTYSAWGGGVNGAGEIGSGFLLDGEGDDRYLVEQGGGNGAGDLGGLGLLVDGLGNDFFHAGVSQFGNGAGALGGMGVLLDAAGDDDRARGFHGLGSFGGIGYLLDGAGDDRYSGTNAFGERGSGSLVDLGGDDAYASNGNGAGTTGGAGVHIDVEGNDSYVGLNGLGGPAGLGILIDFEGDDFRHGCNGQGEFGGAGYLVDIGLGNDVHQGRNGLSCGGNGLGGVGSGFLLDDGGDDAYLDGRNGVGHAGVGFLADLGGNDYYRAWNRGGNGGADGPSSVSFLLDADGNDRYESEHWASNGGGLTFGVGHLLDLDGDDAYLGDSAGANGGGADGGAGFLWDVQGNDNYTAGHMGVNGGAYVGPDFPVSSGLLIDGGGLDWYYDVGLGSYQDRTIVPKGLLGALIDVRGP